jgi:hypothetical protein
LSWSRAFDDPIALLDGRELRTVRDAGTTWPRFAMRCRGLPAWQLPAEMLLSAAKREGMVMLGEVAMRRALQGSPERPPDPRPKSANLFKVIRTGSTSG